MIIQLVWIHTCEIEISSPTKQLILYAHYSPQPTSLYPLNCDTEHSGAKKSDAPNRVIASRDLGQSEALAKLSVLPAVEGISSYTVYWHTKFPPRQISEFERDLKLGIRDVNIRRVNLYLRKTRNHGSSENLMKRWFFGVLML